MRISIVLAAFTLLAQYASAQDSTRGREVSVTSSFKPVLKEAAKVGFSATPPGTDTSRPRLQYSIPNQNLVLGYQPGSLRPLALAIDSGGKWESWNYTKIGYGSFKTPYFETGLSLGDGKTAGLNVYGRHISSKGKIDYQDYGHTSAGLNGFARVGTNIELSGRLSGYDARYNKYGFEPKTLSFPDDSIKVRYQSTSLRFGLHNIERGEFGISYAPSVQLDVFRDGLKNKERNIYFNLPLRKTLGGKFEADVTLEGNATRFSPQDTTVLKSNYFSVAPSLLVKTANLYVQAGLRPSWDNGAFNLLPNIMFEGSSSNKQITLMGGWIGYFKPNSFQSFAQFNPYIWAPRFINNARTEEIYIGIKGALSDHLSYNVKGGLNKYSAHPLYKNDTASGKSFLVINKPNLKAMNFSGEIGYTVGEQFSLRSRLDLNRYLDLKEFDKAWGLLPLQWTTSLRLQVLKDLYVRSDLFAFHGSPYQTKLDGTGRTEGGVDLSAGLEFAVVKHVKVWAQFNNIFGKEYQRWQQYPTYGFNFLGGVVFSFAKSN